MDREAALDAVTRWLAGADVNDVHEMAFEVRRKSWPVITYSPKVFIPLTKLCRDVCHYCTFAIPPRKGERAYMALEEVMALVAEGGRAGCAEALFTLGDKPEMRYRAAKQELAAAGFASTTEMLEAVAGAVLKQTDLLPHLNPGVLSRDEMAALRRVAPSMGLMLESTSPRLGEKGMPHHGSIDKEPARRLQMLREAGELKIPFTTGILIGIGETFEERIDALVAIRELHESYGHIQEVIIQNFRAKPGTPMALWPEPSADETAFTIAIARLLLPPEVSVQAPPNLADGDATLEAYLAAGLNDWGGVSPVTIDHVNPEAPWPAISRLRAVTNSIGAVLEPRLTIYPRYALDPGWTDPAVRPRVLARMDAEGLLADDRWHAGEAKAPPDVIAEARTSRTAIGTGFSSAIDTAMAGRRLSEEQIVRLFAARGSELAALCEAADALRQQMSGDVVTYVINRNINYTNMCYFKCGFCAFSKGPRSLNLRGDPYLLTMEDIRAASVEAAERGATEVCLQGGIHPSFTGDFYVQVVDTIKRALPDIHIHAFSPLEVWQGAETKGVSLKDFLWELKDHGLGTLPGTAAEILDDRVRKLICPDKISTSQWAEVARTAHGLGLRMTSTIMFGHADDALSWARHLLVLRDIQADTGGFTEFVPLPFVHMAAPLWLKGHSRRGPTFAEALKMHAVARLVLHPEITNIQVSWVKMGAEGARMALKAGCNDLGGTLMNEIISRSAGASHGQELTPREMAEIAGLLGRPIAQRTTLYGPVGAHPAGALGR